MWFTILTAVVTVAAILFNIMKKKKNQGKAIPGPSLIEGLRIFIRGSFRNSLHLDLPDLAEKYGPIMRIRLLVQDVVYINDAKIFRRLTSDELYVKMTNDRPPTFCNEYILPSNISLCNINSGNVNKRKVFHSLLKFYGEGVGKFEGLMIQTLKELTESLKGKHEINLSTELRNYVLYVLSTLLSGDCSPHAKDDIDKIRKYSKDSDNMLLFENEMLLQPFPFLRLIPGLRFKRLYDDIMKSKAELLRCFLEPAKSSKTSDDAFTTGIVHDLLTWNSKNSSETVQLNDDDIDGLIVDISVGGYLTTGSSASSLFLHLIKRQDIQKNICDEIERVIGNSQPHFSHRSQMPYTEAVMYENLRYATLGPFMLPHFISEDFVFDGYHMPKNSFLFMHAFYHNHRPDVWGDPWEFRPERYLDENGELLDATHPMRKDSVIFGYGPRKCPGEAFAKSRLFMLVVTLIKQFQFLPLEDETDLPSTDSRNWKTTLVLAPSDFKCKVVSRVK